MLDKLPAWARHLLIVAGATAAGSLASAIVAAGGVTGLDFPAVLAHAVDAGVVAGATAAAALWLTPLTRQYGVGAPKE